MKPHKKALKRIFKKAADDNPARHRITKKETEGFLKELFSQYDKKVKNAIMNILTKRGITKNTAKEKIAMSIRPMLLNRSILSLSLEEIKTLEQSFSQK